MHCRNHQNHEYKRDVNDNRSELHSQQQTTRRATITENITLVNYQTQQPR